MVPEPEALARRAAMSPERTVPISRRVRKALVSAERAAGIAATALGRPLAGYAVENL